jgi:membrane dipeptidase
VRLPEYPPSSSSHALHESALVLDAHTDTLQRVLMDGVDLGERSRADPLVERSDLPRYREGGVDAQIFAVWVDALYLPHHAVRRALQQIDAFHRLLEAHPERVALARTASEVRKAVQDGKLAALLSIEGGDAIGGDLGILRVYQRLGACSMTLCHTRTTDWVDSSTDVARWGGLNDFGREVVREMNRLRLVVDVSHTSDDAVRAVLDVSEAPVIASHSSCRALCDHPRNLSDELLRAVAAAGGVVGINFYSGFLDGHYLEQLRTLYGDPVAEMNTPPQAPPSELDSLARERLHSMLRHGDVPRPAFSRLLDHIDHAVSVSGIDHVGLGGDLDVPHFSTPEGLDDVSHYPRITAGLVERGYSGADIRKILGENFLRVLAEVTERA